MSFPNPIVERENRQGREGFVEHILASLIIGASIPGWNKPANPSEKGIRFLKEIDKRCFGGNEWQQPPMFYCEFELPAKGQFTEKRYPDLAALWDERVLLFELKTEPGSIREGQIDEYLDLALLHYPNRQIDIIFITRDTIAGRPSLKPRCSYANVTWEKVAPLIAGIWDNNDTEAYIAAVAKLFTDYLSQTFTDRSKPALPLGTSATVPDDARLSNALLIAIEVAGDRRQRALSAAVDSPNDAQRLRENVKNVIRAYNRIGEQHVSHVIPWVWETKSGGKPLSEEGKRNGIELRFSYHEKGNEL